MGLVNAHAAHLRTLGLVGLSLASLLLYAWLFTHLTWLASATPTYADLVHGLGPPFTHLADRDRALTPELKQRHGEAAVEFALAVTAALTLYVAAAWLGRGVRGRAATGVVLGAAALFQTVAVLAPDMLSQDVFSYASYGRMLLVHGANPHVEVPAQYPGDVYLDYVYWKFVPSFYGPLWTLISTGLVGLAGEDVARAALLFRALEAVAAVLGAALVLAVLEEFDPRRALAGGILFGWNPLLVVEGGLSGHNDVLMVTLMTLAVALVARGRGAAACTALVLAGLIKFTALALLPLFGIYLLRRAPSWRARAGLLLRCGLANVPLTALILWPVWAGPATFAVGALNASDRYVNSLAEVALGELRAHHGEGREDLAIPLQFRGWWVATHTQTGLMSAPTATAEPLVPLAQWRELLLVAPERQHWMKVYDAESGTIGYVSAADVGPIDRPPWADDDARVLELEEGPVGTASLRRANRDIRTFGSGALVVVFSAGLILGTGSLAGLLQTWMIVFLVVLYATLTWFWPWYALWALPAAALLPRSAWSRLVVYFSWGVLLIYVGLGFEETSLWYVQTFRAIPAFGLPLLLWLGETGIRGALTVARGIFSSRGKRVGETRPATFGAMTDEALGLSAARAEGRSRSRA